MVEVRFVSGTLEIEGLPVDFEGLSGACVWDPRSACHRAQAIAYADLLRFLTRRKIPYHDGARRYEALASAPTAAREPRPYQAEALAAWSLHGGRGVVVLPTGAGKTLVAHMAIADRMRSTLVVAPTLDLVQQWHDGLTTAFGGPIGVIGGGEHDVRPLTVTTYDSAYMHMEHIGARFGLLVFDECHHLPGTRYALAGRLALAPFRLGLTATPEREDGREADLEELIGPLVYRRDIVDLTGDYLAPYETVRVAVTLTPAERDEYDGARALYRAFLARHGISMAHPSGWSQFVIRSSRTQDGRDAMAAYRRQRTIAFTAPAKLAYLERLLHQHRNDRAVIFTVDNATVHAVSRQFLIPAITHQTKVRERSEILAGFAEGRYHAVVTSRVLNEGVDMPDANIAVVMSGSGSVREHVQRLGRVLRKREGKNAVLYELITGGTSESYTSNRRRQHVAYR